VTIAGVVLVTIGLGFMAITAVGILRLPDFFSRAHAVSKTETMGLGLVMLGLAVYNGFNLVSLKLVLAVVFVFLANPVSAHLMTRAALRAGIMPWTRPSLAAHESPGSDPKGG
jgi:multicomponent Na+:H+ antiporter subunit G